MLRAPLPLLALMIATASCRNLDDTPTACSEDEKRCADYDAGNDATGDDVSSDTSDAATDTYADLGSDAPAEAAPDSLTDGADSTGDAPSDSDTASPCVDSMCVTAPPPKCADGVTSRAFSTPGACKAGVCNYPYVDTTCTGETICSGGACSTPPSCAGGLSCTGGENCCATIPVPGGKFSRSYDAINFLDPKFVATISDFSLDKFEVTVGRFRKFVDAVDGGWKPASGSGKHAHLASGGGVNGGTEPGWNAAWSSYLPSDKPTWTSSLTCDGAFATWTDSTAGNENKPINCLNWYQAYAFCIWDGGFLPTEAEWNYAAAGGSEQRIHPWGSADPGLDASHAAYDCYFDRSGPGCTGNTNIAPVGSISAGNGRWGHSDLGGNVWEWTLDNLKNPYNELSCTDCAYFAATSGVARVVRGGSFMSPAPEVASAYRDKDLPDARFVYDGLRCARLP